MSELEELRRQIAEVDVTLLESVARRMELSGQIGELKASRGLGIVDEDVENQVLRRASSEGRRLGLDEKLVENLFSLLLEYSKREQRRRKGVENSDPRP